MYGVAPNIEPVVSPIRHRDLLKKATDLDIDGLVNPVLIRFCATFVDQGFANWSLPHREDGFYKSFLKIYGRHGGPPGLWMNSLTPEIARLERCQIGPEASIIESLNLLGVVHSDWGDYIEATLLALRGWAGVIWQLEVRPDRQAVSVSPGTLLEFLAIRLILERLALSQLAKQ